MIAQTPHFLFMLNRCGQTPLDISLEERVKALERYKLNLESGDIILAGIEKKNEDIAI
jgi:hypothetical protein